MIKIKNGGNKKNKSPKNFSLFWLYFFLLTTRYATASSPAIANAAPNPGPFVGVGVGSSGGVGVTSPGVTVGVAVGVGVAAAVGDSSVWMEGAMSFEQSVVIAGLIGFLAMIGVWWEMNR